MLKPLGWRKPARRDSAGQNSCWISSQEQGALTDPQSQLLAAHTPRSAIPSFLSAGEKLGVESPLQICASEGKEFCWRVPGGSAGWHQFGVDAPWSMRAVDGESGSRDLADFPPEGGRSLPKTAPMSSKNQFWAGNTALPTTELLEGILGAAALHPGQRSWKGLPSPP